MRRANYKRRLICSVYVAITGAGQALGFQRSHHPLSPSLGLLPFGKRHALAYRYRCRYGRRAEGSRRDVSQRRVEANGSDFEVSSKASNPVSSAPTTVSRPRSLGLVSLISRVVRGARGLAVHGGALDPSTDVALNGKSSSKATQKKSSPDNRDELERLKRENILLRETVFRLEAENEKLQQDFANRIVIETFEGEGRIRKAREEAIQEEMDDMDASFMLMSEEQMLYDDPAQWCDELEDGACPVEPMISFGEALRDRAYWLVGLLVMQSLSGIILARNEALLANHPVSLFMLTCLVGAGGNAGNQASVRVIRGLALGSLNEETQAQFLTRELKMAVSLSFILAVAGFLRTAVFHAPLPDTLAITAALAMIVFSGICLGAVLPLILKRIGVDPAHSSTTIQVIMDILGVIITVIASNVLLDSPFGQFLTARLSRG